MIPEEENEKLKDRIKELEDEVKRLKKVEREYEKLKATHSLTVSNLKRALKIKTNFKKLVKPLGAPKGHKGYARHNPERIDYIRQLIPKRCPHCHTKLRGETQEIRSRHITNIRLTSKNLAPEEINSVDDLVQEGKGRLNSTSIAGHVFGPAIPEADLYFARALDLMRQQRIQSPILEFDIELHLGAYLGFMRRYDEAVPHFKRCVELKPQDIGARIALAKVYRDVERPAESAGQYIEAAKLSKFSSLGKYSSLARALSQYLRAA